MPWRERGYRRPTAVDDADLVILNTCHIREKAAEKVYSRARPPAEAEARQRARTAAS